MRGHWELSVDQCLELIASASKLRAFADSLEVRGLAAFARCRSDASGQLDEFASAEIAAHLRVSGREALERISLSVQLVGRLPATLDALEQGTIDRAKARILVRATEPLDQEQAGAVEREQLPRAGDLTAGQLRAAVQREVLRVDPEGAQRRFELRKAQRKVELQPEPDSMASFKAYLPADQATRIFQKIDRLARKADNDGRSMDARRADVFAELVLNPGAHAGGKGGTLVYVTVGATTLLRLDDKPGYLAGYGPIPAEMARGLAADSTWRRVLTDPDDGSAISCGRTTYRPSTALAEFVQVRNQTCAFPGCQQPSQGCDLDHSKPWPLGQTSASNITPLCRVHHLLKTHGDWKVQNMGKGKLVWISPTGRRYETRPEPIADPDRPSPIPDQIQPS